MIYIFLISFFEIKIYKFIIISKVEVLITAILDPKNSASNPKINAPTDIKLKVIVCIPITLPLNLSGTFN